jgi:hypothetical protein
MASIDLNGPINWAELDDFDGEARELAGDFFFEVESDEGKLSSLLCLLRGVTFEQRRTTRMLKIIG